MKNKIVRLKTKNGSHLLHSLISAVLLELIISYSGYAQRNYLFENISVAHGLSNNLVHNIFQDSNGFLWISTADGLNRYDGYNLKVFKNDPNDSTSLPNNFCRAITEDSDGFIWIGISGNAIVRYDPKDESFEKYPIETGSAGNNTEFYSALYDTKGNLWFGGSVNGIQKFNKSNNRFEQIYLDSISNNNSHWGEINCITELKNGDLLVTDYESGIKIYNGKLNLFQSYYLKTNYTLNRISALYEDKSGNIWIGSRNQLLKYSPSLSTTEGYDLLSQFRNSTVSGYITKIVQDDEGYLWFGALMQGLHRFDPGTKNIQKFEFNPDRTNYTRTEVIGTIYQDKYGVIWIANLTDGLNKFDPLKEPINFSKFPANEVTVSNTIHVTVLAKSQQDKEITIGTSTKGLFSYNLESKKLIGLKFKFNQGAIPDGKVNIQSLVIDNEGNRWFAYNNLGLHKIDTNNFLSVTNSPNKKKVLTYNTNSMKIDLSGNIWLASTCGFEKYNPSKNEFTLLPSIMNKKMSDNFKQNIYEITQSRKTVSSILKVGEASNSEKKFSLDSDQKVLVICVGEGNLSQRGLYDTGSLLTGDGKLIWSMNNIFETFNDGGGFANRIAVKCMDLKKGDYKITFVSDIGHSFGNWNILAPPDSMWYGIQVLNLNETEYNNLNEINEKEINSEKFMPVGVGSSIELSKALKNVLWLGAQRNGLFKFDLATGNFKQYNFDSKNSFSPNNSIVFIFEDRDGIVWIATQSNLLKFDPLSEKFEKFDQKDGLPSSLVYSIIEDLQGNLWINTSGGLSRLNKNAPKDDWNFVNYDLRDGLHGFSNSKASWISKDGEMIFGSNGGIYSFYPEKANKVKPDIVINDIKVSEISLKSDSCAVKLEKSIMKTHELNLSYTQNNISFEFASIHFSRPAKNKIMYKLEGFNNHWISTDRNFVSFTNLEPGAYTFRVKGSNSDGIWNEEGKAIQLIINPPWWKTWLAYGIYILLLIGAILVVHRYQKERTIRLEKEKSQKRELEQAKEIEKAYHKLGKAHETLKATQSQLIQSEKMASLGELTAGIAHEIQNPLNFVKNFSEVSNDLIDEMNEELDKGEINEAKLIAGDIKQNLEKITHHGKRADAIVKGMLQHSRTSTGQKELSDINKLADEYLRLAYHGLRAKDKSLPDGQAGFNAEFKTDFDPNLPKINVIPQDIGRVLLNLINNAFYAVTAPPPPPAGGGIKNAPADYKPTVIVSTTSSKSPSGDLGVEIRVIDNGPGIPKKILDKIFQPFFTTKPTGQGTGLGLSLAYDIVKAHGGELKVETKEARPDDLVGRGEGSEFILLLPA